MSVMSELEQGCKPFDEWDESAQERLIKDIYSPFDTVNS